MSTTQQRYQALERAQEVRLARAELKRRIARGDVFAASVLLDPPAEAETWPVGQLIIAQRLWGKTRMRKVLGRLNIAEVKPVGRLTERQRKILARVLGGEDKS